MYATLTIIITINSIVGRTSLEPSIAFACDMKPKKSRKNSVFANCVDEVPKRTKITAQSATTSILITIHAAAEISFDHKS